MLIGFTSIIFGISIITAIILHSPLINKVLQIAGYSFLAEGTTNATWGGSTQGTLDDLAEQDNDIHEQSVGYSR